MNPGTVSIHLVTPADTSSHTDCGCLTETDHQRAASFRFREDAARWIACRAALRRILGEAIQLPPHRVPLVLTEFGKPVLPPPFDFLHFSLSHCNDLALVALSIAGPVGVDLEPVARASELAGCEATFCHPAEIKMLPSEPATRHLRLLEIWTAKEALLKALGTGFSHPPEKVRVHPDTASGFATSDSPLPGIGNQIVHRLLHPLLAAHCATLSAPTSITRINIVAHPPSTSAMPSVITPVPSTRTHG